MPDSARLRVDLHAHSHASHDCVSTPSAILRAMDRAAIDVLAITDHNEIRGALELHRLAPDRILVGEEVKTAERVDVIGLLLHERIPAGTPAWETCERILEQGGVVYVPHPFDTRRAGGGAVLERIAELVDVVEGHNARTWRAAVNERGERWARDAGKLVGAGSDAHCPAEIGRAYVEVPPFERTREGVLGALAQGRIGARGRTGPLYTVVTSYARVRKLLGGRATGPTAE